MITAVIVDDELRGRIALRQKLKNYCPQVEVIDEASSGAEGIKLIEKHHPQIVFLDIEMPLMNGFEMLQCLPDKDFHLIFTTAYDQYAIKAIRYAAFDYLLKPIDVEELQSSVRKIMLSSPQNHTQERLQMLEQNLQNRNALQKIAIPSMEGLHFFDVGDIVYLKAESNYTNIHFMNHPRVVASKTLRDFEDLLPSETFFRPHHSYIINLRYIKRYLKGDGGQIEMLNGDYVDVARRKKEEFLRIIR